MNTNFDEYIGQELTPELQEEIDEDYDIRVLLSKPDRIGNMNIRVNADNIITEIIFD